MNNSIQSTIILLIEQIVVALGGEFKLYLPQLIPHMLRVFMHDNSQRRIGSVKVCGKLQPAGLLWVLPGQVQAVCLVLEGLLLLVL